SRRRLALSGVISTGDARPGERRLARFRKQPTREVLHAHQGRHERAATRKRQLGSCRARYSERDADDPGIKHALAALRVPREFSWAVRRQRFVMKLLRTFIFRLRALFRGEQLDAEMHEEMRHHLEMTAAKKVANGVTPAQARVAAQRSFGGVDQIREQCRD